MRSRENGKGEGRGVKKSTKSKGGKVVREGEGG